MPAIYRVHAQPDPARIERLLEQLAALGVPTPPLGQGALAAQRRRSPPRRAGWCGARPGAADTAARRIHRSCSAPSSRPTTASATAATPASAAPPTRTSPRRSAATPTWSCTGRCWRRWGGGGGAARLAEARDVAADCSARERESAKIERGADDVCAAYLLERELGERGREASFEGEVSGVIRAGAFVSFGGELGDVYEGMLPARRMPGDYFELDRAEVALVGRKSGSTLRLGDPISVRVSGVDPARGRADLEPADG